MVIDKNLELSDAQVMTASTVFYSTNVVDTEAAASNIGGGTPLWLVCRIQTTLAGTSGTLIVALQDCATSGGTYLDIAISPTYTTAQCVKGFDLLTIPLPVDNLRYLGMRYTPATGTGYPTGKVSAFITSQAPKN